MVDTSGESENRSRAAPERSGAPTRNSDAYLKLLALTLVIILSSTSLVAGQSQSQEREKERHHGSSAVVVTALSPRESISFESHNGPSDISDLQSS